METDRAGAERFVLTVTPTVTFADCPPLDVICVPGGYGTDDLLNDEEVLVFLRSRAESARYITSVCTGSLVLGAAGLLIGYRATTHIGAPRTSCRFLVQRHRENGFASIATESVAVVSRLASISH